jgi:hypothetical protein
MRLFYSTKTNKIGFRKNSSLIFLFFILCSVFSLQLTAQNYIVNSNADAAAVNLVTGETATPGQITLRSAIQAATAQPGAHIITFSGAVVSPINLSLGQITTGNAANGNNITITGPGMNSLTVNQTTENRIFSTGTGAVTFLLQDITLNYAGPAVTAYSGGGGAIIAGGAGAVTTLINCRITNFQRQLGNGGAISASSSLANHSLTITNCIFTNNRAGGAGGAVSFNSQGGTATITGCTFDNNHTGPVGANTGGDGGAVSVTGGGLGGTYLIEKNTFLNNQVENVTGHGGAVINTNGILTLRFNRFIGNTCANVAFPPLANIVAQTGGTLNFANTTADNNWWGVNTGPGANDATALAAGGTMIVTKWLQLKTTASPNPICNTPAGLGNTTTVTTSFLSNSASEAIAVGNLSTLIGLTVIWGPTTLGSLSAQQGTIQANGTATATFTSNGTGGNALVNTQVDNVPTNDLVARATIVVNTIPVVTADPSNFTSCVGGTATFTATITGTPTPTFQWRIGTTVLVNGLQASGSTVSGATTTTLTITNVQPGDEVATYNVRASNHCGEDISANASLIVNSVTGGTVGSDQTICSGGDPAAFTESVASTGDGVLSYQWQSSTTGCGGAFSNIGGATGITYDPPAGLTLTTTYRRVTTSTQNAVPCTANSNCITVTINNVTGGSTVFSSVTICPGGDPPAFTESVASTGDGVLSYQWQSSISDCSTGFINIEGATNTTYDPPAFLIINTNTHFRRVTTSTLNGVACTANSNCITVTKVSTPAITCPTSSATAACQTQTAVNNAFTAWLATASGSGGIVGVLTNNNTGAPPACGGATTVTFTYTNNCDPVISTCQATFTVTAPNAVVLTCAVNTSTAGGQTQTAVNTAFAAWLATASGSGGCNGVLTNNNSGAPPAGGGATTVTFTYTSSCAPLTTTCQATFTVLPPVSITCPVNSTAAACQTQAAINTQFATWLATASASGGCSGVLTNDNTGAPSACGGSTTVLFTYTSTCEPFTTTCSATFTVTAPTVVSLTCPVNTSTAACLTQAQVNTAFSAWLATASASGGCNGILTNNNTGAPSACGGATTVTFTYTSSCAPLTTTCQATFTVPGPPIVSLTCPVNTSTAACLTQAQVNTAFSAWLATASASGGCNGILTNNNTGAPPACGGATTVTFTYTSICAPLTTTCQATFTVPAPPIVSLTCPVNTSTAACLTQAQVNTAFSAWLATASASGGCNGILTNNNTGTPPACGGSTTVTFTYTSSCAPFTTTCQATFTVPAPPIVSLTCPVNTSTAACLTQAQVNTAFSAWLATASVSGGCNGFLSNNNTGAPPACGGATTVTFTFTSSCAPFTTTCQATFTVPVAPTVSLTCPVNTTTSACLTQAQINTAFSAWLATASASGGCNGVLSNNNTGAPDACDGGSTTVTFTFTSSCVPFTTTCQATFTVPAPESVVLTCPVNTTTATCQTQAQINTAFAAWLATASASGGCSTSLTNNNTGAPSSCGGSTTVTFTYTSSCAPFTTSCQATFTVPQDATPPSITNVTATPVSLWPPNHKMRDVVIGYTATDCGAVTTSLSVASNEPINGTGDGDIAPDWEIIDNHNVKLRAERAGNGNGRTYTITITATDACGNSSTATATVIVAHNITAPVSGNSFKVGSTVNFSGTFWDKPGNKHTGKWLIDGSALATATITEPVGNQNGRSTGSYKFNTPGVYKLQMNITDQTGATSYANTNGDLEAIVVIYDPNGGYTYGGGWYQSQAGAVVSNPASTGKASYGFTVNYYKNATNPKGESQFEFKVGTFEFNALNFDYLSIQGARAQFRGTGKITGGQSGVAFIMTVIDGELDGTGIDKVRMKIFNKTTNAVYYDNQPGASDAASPVVPVGTNSTVVVQGTPVNNLTTKTNKEVVPEIVPVDGLEISAFPNPTNDHFVLQVQTSGKELIHINVMDILGRKVKEMKVGPYQTVMFGSEFIHGVYFVEIKQGSNRKVIKLEKL